MPLNLLGASSTGELSFVRAQTLMRTMQPENIICYRLPPTRQQALLDEVIKTIDMAPFFRPTLPRWGTPFSVLMSNCGALGWVSDKSGYRYQPAHPQTGKPWPDMPQSLLELWSGLTDYPAPPEACLINYYQDSAKMGLHQDKDEKDFNAPVLSISLGDDARFRLGGSQRSDPTTALRLSSGDVMQLRGDTRLSFHGIDKIYPETCTLLSRYPEHFPGGGRLNLTLRRVNGV